MYGVVAPLTLASGSTRTLASYPIEVIAIDRPVDTESIGLPSADAITTLKELVSYFEPGFFNIPIATAMLGLLSVDGSQAPSLRRLRKAFVIVSSPVLCETVAAALNCALFPSVTYVSCAVYASLGILTAFTGIVIWIVAPDGTKEAGVNVIVYVTGDALVS